MSLHLPLFWLVLVSCDPAGDPASTHGSSALAVRVDPAPPAAVRPESDAGATIDPDRDIVLTWADGSRVQVTDLPGAEDGEALSPDGRHLAFLAAPNGLAAVFVTEVPGPGQPLGRPVQLTNVGLERARKAPGRMPDGFVPLPEQGPLRWRDARTIEWDAQGRIFSASLP